jgi:hypothetical protein
MLSIGLRLGKCIGELINDRFEFLPLSHTGLTE